MDSTVTKIKSDFAAAIFAAAALIVLVSPLLNARHNDPPNHPDGTGLADR